MSRTGNPDSVTGPPPMWKLPIPWTGRPEVHAPSTSVIAAKRAARIIFDSSVDSDFGVLHDLRPAREVGADQSGELRRCAGDGNHALLHEMLAHIGQRH